MASAWSQVSLRAIDASLPKAQQITPLHVVVPVRESPDTLPRDAPASGAPTTGYPHATATPVQDVDATALAFRGNGRSGVVPARRARAIPGRSSRRYHRRSRR